MAACNCVYKHKIASISFWSHTFATISHLYLYNALAEAGKGQVAGNLVKHLTKLFQLKDPKPDDVPDHFYTGVKALDVVGYVFNEDVWSRRQSGSLKSFFERLGLGHYHHHACLYHHLLKIHFLKKHSELTLLVQIKSKIRLLNKDLSRSKYLIWHGRYLRPYTGK